MDKTVSIYIIRIKGSSYYTQAQLFPELHHDKWVRFSLQGKQYLKVTGREVERRQSPVQLFSVSRHCIKQKQLHRRVSFPDFPSLDSPWKC